MTAQTKLLAFRLETQLENHLRTHPSILGLDVLIIRKQVTTTFGGRVDLLAITATGVIHCIELKLGGTTTDVVGQVADYLYWAQQLDRAEIISVAARGPFGVDLEAIFPERFGHPLPEVINQTQVLTIIAAAIDLRTQRGMMAIRHPGLETSMFRYVVRAGTVSLIQCGRDGPDLEAVHAEAGASAPQPGVTAPVSYRSTGYRVPIDETTRVFWQSQDLTAPVVLASDVYELYVQWVHAKRSGGLELHLIQCGLFSRQLVALFEESGEWARVFVPTRISTKALAALKSLPSTRSKPAAGHQTVAYLRNPDYQASAA